MLEFNVFKNIIVNKVTGVCICWLKLWLLNCNARNGQYKKDENLWIQILVWNIVSCHEIPGSHVYNHVTAAYGRKNSKFIYDRSLTLRSEMIHSILLRITLRVHWLLMMYVNCLAECLYSTRKTQPLLNNITNSPDRSTGFILVTSQHCTKFEIYNCE